ncbi:hypothetical protein [Salinarchaeum laminariae]|uniref:hypothetical protein n=1 Tax=Salinarchaeum laminariae TaxID=869888 RepID=UPI0020C15A2F|nr:hypothetical protein [Salinarchaeum laminariae]
MVANPDDKSRSEQEPNSRHYGNEQSTDDVFENPHNPKSGELAEALAATAHLTEAEARGFAWGVHDNFPPVPHDSDEADDVIQTIGFDDMAEFEDAAQRGKEKVGDAIWISELIDAYRFHDLPECRECGTEIDGPAISPEDESGIICANCTDKDLTVEDPGQQH